MHTHTHVLYAYIIICIYIFIQVLCTHRIDRYTSYWIQLVTWSFVRSGCRTWSSDWTCNWNISSCAWSDSDWSDWVQKRGGRRVPALKKKVAFPLPNLAPNKTYKSSGRRDYPVVWHSVLHHGHWRSSWTCHPTRDDPNDDSENSDGSSSMSKAPRRSTLWESRVYNVLDLIIQKIGYFIGLF